MRSAALAPLPPGPRLPAPVQTLLIWRWPLVFLERCRHRYGTAFTIDITSHPPLVFLSDPADIRAVLVAPPDVLDPGEGAETIEPLVGEQSFMLAEGEQHLCGRRAVLPPFHAGAVRERTELLGRLAARHLASWPRDVSVALHPHLRTLTLGTLLGTMFAGAADPDEDRVCQLRDELLAMLAVTATTLLPVPVLRRGPGRRTWGRFLRRRAAVDELIHAIIENRARTAAGATGDLLDRLLDARNPDGSPFSRSQVRDDLMSIVVAGHETTASELAWAFQLLAHNPRVQDRLVQELDAGRGETYLTATVQEILRHRPVFLFAIPRAVRQPVEIGGWTYRPDCQLLACIYLLQHDPHLYPDPHCFRPERFLENPSAPAAWLPWGGGRKRCPGQHLAMFEIKTVLRTVLTNVRIFPARRAIERPRWRSVIVTPHRGCEVVLRPRSSPRSVATRH